MACFSAGSFVGRGYASTYIVVYEDTYTAGGRIGKAPHYPEDSKAGHVKAEQSMSLAQLNRGTPVALKLCVSSSSYLCPQTGIFVCSCQLIPPANGQDLMRSEQRKVQHVIDAPGGLVDDLKGPSGAEWLSHSHRQTQSVTLTVSALRRLRTRAKACHSTAKAWPALQHGLNQQNLWL